MHIAHVKQRNNGESYTPCRHIYKLHITSCSLIPTRQILVYYHNMQKQHTSHKHIDTEIVNREALLSITLCKQKKQTNPMQCSPTETLRCTEAKHPKHQRL